MGLNGLENKEVSTRKLQPLIFFPKHIPEAKDTLGNGTSSPHATTARPVPEPRSRKRFPQKRMPRGAQTAQSRLRPLLSSIGKAEAFRLRLQTNSGKCALFPDELQRKITCSAAQAQGKTAELVSRDVLATKCPHGLKSTRPAIQSSEPRPKPPPRS